MAAPQAHVFDFEVWTLIQNDFSFNISGAVTHMVLIPLPQRRTRERHVTGSGASKSNITYEFLQGWNSRGQ